MKSRTLALGVVVTVILLTIAGGLYVMLVRDADAGGEHHGRKALALVEEIEQLFYNWNIRAHRVKSDPSGDLDSLAAFVPRIAGLKENLTTAIRSISDPPDSLARDVDSYASAIDAKAERIERFTDDYAVVRNSLRNLPLAATNLAQLADDTGDENLVRTVANFTNSIDSYLIVTPNEESRRRLTGELQDLRRASASYPLPLVNAFADFIYHGETLLAWRGPTEALFQEAMSDDISEPTDRLVGDLELYLDERQARTTYYELGILSVVGTLALFWILLAVQYRIRGGSGPIHAVSGTPGIHPEAVSPAPGPVIDVDPSATKESLHVAYAAVENELLIVEDEPRGDIDDDPLDGEDELLIIEDEPFGNEDDLPATWRTSPRVPRHFEH